MATTDEDYDLFISYASADDDRAAPFDRWVTRFVEALRKTLKTKLKGREPKIYFDRRVIEANHQLEEILRACKRSRIFLAVQSSTYHSRDWTRYEVEAFSSLSPTPERTFVVELEDCGDTALLQQLQHRHAMRFYERTAEAMDTIPLPMNELPFYQRISDLALQIAKQLEALQAPGRVPAGTALVMKPVDTIGSAAPTEKTVLLAQVTEDLEEERLAMARYLEQYGYKILPKQGYPQGGPAFEEAFAADLKMSDLVVQLLGPIAGRTPPDLPVGYARHQASAAKSSGVDLMQWRRSDIQLASINDAAQRELLSGSDVTASTLEEFKSSVLTRLRKVPVAARSKAEFLIFINSETADRPTAKMIKQALHDTYSVVLPLDNTTGSVQEDFNRNLIDCDALLLLYGEAGPEWIRRQLSHLRKVRAGRSPLRGAICYGPPPVKPSVDYSVPELFELDCRDTTGQWSVESILAALPKWTT